MIDLNLSEETKSSLSTYSDPFNKKSIETIRFRIGKGCFKKDKMEYDAWVEFKSNDTSGEHKIAGTSFEDLVNKVKSFVDSLE
jgi:hypothetical protein